MSIQLIYHSPDLKKLRDEGYELEIRGGFLLVHHVPYVNANREIKYGTLVSSLNLPTPEKTAKPQDHVIHFIGDHPCNYDGSIITLIQHPNSKPQTLDAKNNITINHSFSNRPANGFNDYYEKVTSYIRVIASQAQAIDENAKAQTFNVIESLDADYVFKYVDTNSSRAEINTISSKLKNLKVAIIGAGGTGSYVLDFVAKTPVKEIHLFDGDVFFLHNAFRAPGAASVEQLLQVSKKVKYLHDIYSKMHRYIFPHEEHLDGSNLEQLLGMSFIFICIDNGNAKKVIVEKLIGSGIPFVDVGIGVQALGNKLGGSVRITTGTATKHDHINDMIPFNDNGNDDY